jgi:DNA polymerase elongation subunit (family B)
MDLHELVSKLKALASELGRTPNLREFVAMAQVSRRQIDKHKYSTICKAAGLEINKHSATTKPVLIENRMPKILAFDIETAPLLVHVFQLYGNDAIGLNQIKDDSFILSFAAKFLDEDKIYYFDNRTGKNKQDDKKIIMKAYELFKKADILLGHNIDRFDIKKMNARFIKYGLDPLPKIQTIDTLKIAKRYFSFTSNKLEYLATFLGCTPKSSHQKFTGLSLWTECLKNNKEAYDELRLYNEQDVLTQIEVYLKLAKYDESINFQAYTQQVTCICSSTEFYKNGIKYSKNGQFQIYKCAHCGKNYIGKENLIHKDIRKGFFK